MDKYFYSIILDKDINVKIYNYKSKQHNVTKTFSKIKKYGVPIKNQNETPKSLSIRLHKLDKHLDNLFSILERQL